MAAALSGVRVIIHRPKADLLPTLRDRSQCVGVFTSTVCIEEKQTGYLPSVSARLRCRRYRV